MGSLYDGTGAQVGLTDLNQATVIQDTASLPTDVAAVSADCCVRVFFRDLEAAVVHEIRSARVVLGCVAWLTSFPILDELAKKETVQIIVQKEDFLRPDMNPTDGWRERLRARYDALPSRFDRYDFPSIVSALSTGGDPGIEPVRCCGNYNRDRKPAFPRMHHKFLLFCNTEKYDARDDPSDPYWRDRIVPYAAWTGSFNLTKNATCSLENAVLISDPFIVGAYASEYGRCVAFSEPLDWTADWVAPEWRIGT